MAKTYNPGILKYLPSVLFLAMGCVLEFEVFQAWFFKLQWSEGFLLHVGAIVSLALSLLFWKKQASKRDKRASVFTFSIILIVFFPIIGFVVALIFYLPIHFGTGKLQIGLYDDYEEYISEKLDKSNQWKIILNAKQQLRREIGFQPIADIMAGRDIKLKVKAIARLSKNISRENVQMLKQALRDELSEVRMYAASALIKMDQEINEQINLTKQWVQKRGSASDFAQLGNLYQAYTTSGLVDEALAKHYLRLTTEAYRQALDQDTEQPQIVVNYAQCLLELKENERAKIVLNRAFKIWPNDVNIVFLRNEALFRLGQMDQISDGFSSLTEKSLDESQQKVKTFWTLTN